MKRAGLLLSLCAGAALAPCGFAQTEAELARRRIAQMEDERKEIKIESMAIASGQNVEQSLRATRANENALNQGIARLEGVIKKFDGMSAEAARDREVALGGPVKSREEQQQRAIGDIVKDIAGEAAPVAAEGPLAAVGAILTIYEKGQDYKIRYDRLRDIDQRLAKINAGRNEYRAALILLYHDLSQQIRNHRRLDELLKRDRELLVELDRTRAHLATLGPARARANLTRDHDDRGDKALEAQAEAERKAAARVIYPRELAGAWMATGYRCNGAEPDESIAIRYSPEEGLVATKVHGDECVHANEVTWQGKLEGRVIHGKVRLRGRNAPMNSGSWKNVTLEVISVNEIRGFGVRFHRPAVR